MSDTGQALRWTLPPHPISLPSTFTENNVPSLRHRSLLCFLLVATFQPLVAQRSYVPPRGDGWEIREPSRAGFDAERLAAAVGFARSREIGWSQDLAAQLNRLHVNEPFPELIGPVTPRGGTNGIILRQGYVVAEWGDTRRVDMTFSVTKSFLSLVAGLAVDRGLLSDLHAPVSTQVDDPDLRGPHNGTITWHHFLTQTSEWNGTLWDKPDVADRRAGRDRELQAPGTFWEYNDVRVNRTSHALLQAIGRPLPQFLREELMDPIGASGEWVWHGYDSSWVTMGGTRVQSVSGGGHWGGGLWIGTRDMARVGLLMLRRGMWGSRQVLSPGWIDAMTTPVPLRPNYGYLWWLNTGRTQYPGASASSFFALGGGGNVIWIDPETDVVAVVRWMDPRAVNEFMTMVTGALVP